MKSEIKKLETEVREWAEELGVKPKEIQVAPLENKWGSCSSTGILTFSNELLNKSKDFRANIIVHELLHLRYRDHNKIFNLLWQAYLNKKGISLSDEWRI